MSRIAYIPRLIIVDTDTAMAQVLKTHAVNSNFEADVFSDSAEACAALAEKVEHPELGRGYDCIVLGWPKGKIRIIADLLIALSSKAYSDLPLIILSEEPDQELQSLCSRRENTQTLLWHEYKRINSVLAEVAPNERQITSASSGSNMIQSVLPQGTVSNRLPTSVLLVDSTPAVCNVLQDKLESNGYFVALAASAAEARDALAKNNFDLVLTEFNLPDESGDVFCHYLESLNSNRRPVYAVMAEHNLESIVSRSLSIGAIACLDKSESTEILYARLNAIATGLSSRAAANRKAAQANSAAVTDVLQTVKVPSLLIDKHRHILAANDLAAVSLCAESVDELQSKNFEKLIHGAPIRRSIDTPVKALFKTLNGNSLSVAYRCREIDLSEHGITDAVHMLTFESVESKAIETTSKQNAVSTAPATATDQVAHTVETPVENVSGDQADKETVSAPVAEAVVAQDSSNDSVNGRIASALSDKATDSYASLLMLDMKMVAAVTGDRLSLGYSEPMLEIVKAALARRCAPQDTLKYIGGGKFVVLYKSDDAAKSRDKAEKLVSRIPELDTQLKDVQLMSHASYIGLPRQSDLSADYLLKHCTAACMRAELDGLDNQIFRVEGFERAVQEQNVVATQQLRDNSVTEEVASV